MGGLGLFSFHGASVAETLSAEDRQRVETHGILALPVRGLSGLFPTYYNTFHAEAYVRDRWTRFGAVLEIEDRGINNHQDLVVLRKGAEGFVNLARLERGQPIGG